jgi:polyribonucleotide nucleotidyltransferase
MIRKIQEETGTEINVEDDGSVEIAAVSGENLSIINISEPTRLLSISYCVL